MKSLYWPHLTHKEISQLIQDGIHTAILPFGSTEQHGPHLMTGNDYLFAERLAMDLAQYFNALVLPPIPFGKADHHMEFTGTITVRESVLIDLLSDIAQSLEKSGITQLVICNGHGGNYPVIAQFSEQWSGKLTIFHDAHEKALFESATSFLDEFTSGDLGIHAGLLETSIAMHTHPDYGVRTDELELGALPRGTQWTSEEITPIIGSGLHAVTQNGVLGDPRKSTSELGKRFYEAMVKMYISFFEKKGLKVNHTSFLHHAP